MELLRILKSLTVKGETIISIASKGGVAAKAVSARWLVGAYRERRRKGAVHLIFMAFGWICREDKY